MNNQKGICVVGHFGEGLNLLNGQTVKTKIVTNEIENAFGAKNVYKVDTHGGVKAVPRLLYNLWRSLRKSKDVVIFLSDNGLRFIVPVLRWMNALAFGKRRFHFVVIGGYIQDYLPSYPYVLKTLQRYDGIYVETVPMQKAMKELGFRNVRIMPNCKELKVATETKNYQAPPFRFCTFSRVMKSKGIEEAAEAIELVNKRAGKIICSLDIYGQIEASEKDWFENLVQTTPDTIQYKGLVPFADSVKVLCDYYALLFPTYYKGEGFAGTLIDSFAAGVPVIASDWRYNASIVKDGETGRIFKTNSIDELVSAIEFACNHTTIWNEMKQNCLKEAVNYQPDIVVQPLIKALQHGN